MAKKTKVPKHIAGVKVPKPLRRGLKALARSQNGRTVLTEALVAAAGVLAAHEAQPGSRTRQAAADAGPKVKAKAAELAGEARSFSGHAGAFEDAARAFVDSLKRRDTSAAAENSTPPLA